MAKKLSKLQQKMLDDLKALPPLAPATAPLPAPATAPLPPAATSPTINQKLTERFGSWDSIQSDPEKCYHYIQAQQKLDHKARLTEISQLCDDIDYQTPYRNRIRLALEHIRQNLFTQMPSVWRDHIRTTLRDIPEWEKEDEEGMSVPIRNFEPIKKLILGIGRSLDIDEAMSSETGYLNDNGNVLQYDPPDTLEDYLTRVAATAARKLAPQEPIAEKQLPPEEPPDTPQHRAYLASEAHQRYLKIRAEFKGVVPVEDAASGRASPPGPSADIAAPVPTEVESPGAIEQDRPPLLV